MIGMTELMLDGPLTEQQRDSLETIRSSGTGLLVILKVKEPRAAAPGDTAARADAAG